MRVTIRDVGNRARVSPKTVSNVVNGTSPVSPETRRRVEDAIRELNYVPNLSARGLRNGRSGLIAVALPDPGSSYSASLIGALVTSARRRGLTVQLEAPADTTEREAQLLSRARSHLLDGLVLHPVLPESATVEPAMSLPPVVLVGEVDQPAFDHVWTDNVAAIRELTTLLIEGGHRRIALLDEPKAASHALRQQGYQEALCSAGLVVDPALEIPIEGWTAADGALAIRDFLARYPPPEAVVCCSDTLALGVIGALWVDGYRVPDDISVVGYDDIPEAALTVPPLTTVHVDRTALAETVLDLLTSRRNDPAAPPRSITLPHHLVHRVSTRTR